VEWILDASLDGAAWRTVHEGSLKSGEPAGALFELDAAVTAAVSPVRFLRLHTRGGTGGSGGRGGAGAGGARRQSHFVEIELYGAVVGGVSEPLRALGPPPRWAAAAAAQVQNYPQLPKRSLPPTLNRVFVLGATCA
jgi:hypothetical protein